MNDRESLNSHKVIVFILDLDRSQETLHSIKSALTSCDSDNDVAVFVHINGSNAEHSDRIMQAFADETRVQISRSGNNLGYSGGNNHLLSVLIKGGLGDQYILLLNNDAYLEPDTIAKLRSALLVNPDAGVVGPRILLFGTNGTIAADGAGTLPWIMQQYFRNSGKHSKDCPAPLPFDVPFVPGTCMMMRVDLLARLGGFDEKFFRIFLRTGIYV
jgi:Predicted glycosyltransferases